MSIAASLKMQADTEREMTFEKFVILSDKISANSKGGMTLKRFVIMRDEGSSCRLYRAKKHGEYRSFTIVQDDKKFI